MTNRRTNPLTINLKELSAEGQDYNYSRESGELSPYLADLIGSNPYKIEFRITPTGNSYDLRGRLETVMDLQCSRCAGDFKYPIQIDLHEMIVMTPPMGKGDQQSRANHAHEWEAEGPDYIVLQNHQFSVVDYVHEMIALAEPIRPLGRPDCDENCENLAEGVQRSWLSIGTDDAFKAHNPFQVLEKVKLKS